MEPQTTKILFCINIRFIPDLFYAYLFDALIFALCVPTDYLEVVPELCKFEHL